MNRDLFVAALAACVGATAGAATTAVMLGVTHVQDPAASSRQGQGQAAGANGFVVGAEQGSAATVGQAGDAPVGGQETMSAPNSTFFLSVAGTSDTADDVVVDQVFACLLNGQPQEIGRAHV